MDINIQADNSDAVDNGNLSDSSDVESTANESVVPKLGSLEQNSSGKREKKSRRRLNFNPPGTWVECTKSSCKKWRYLPDVHDPNLLPVNWQCSNNTDPQTNNCDVPEETYQDLIRPLLYVYTKFVEGSLVWARMDGYPWWPGMIESDPDLNHFFEEEFQLCVPSAYHVVFCFDSRVTRSWIAAKYVRAFTEDASSELRRVPMTMYKTEVYKATDRALEALKLSLRGLTSRLDRKVVRYCRRHMYVIPRPKDRISEFGFGTLYKGRWSRLSFYTLTGEDTDHNVPCTNTNSNDDDALMGSVDAQENDDSEMKKQRRKKKKINKFTYTGNKRTKKDRTSSGKGIIPEPTPRPIEHHPKRKHERQKFKVPSRLGKTSNSRPTSTDSFIETSTTNESLVPSSQLDTPRAGGDFLDGLSQLNFPEDETLTNASLEKRNNLSEEMLRHIEGLSSNRSV